MEPLKYTMKNDRRTNGLPSRYPQGHFNPKKCRNCGTMYTPNAPSIYYCSQRCADVGHISAYLMRNYGITYADYTVMEEAQDHRCALCDRKGYTMAEYHILKLVVDHDHKTGRVRGLLCHDCNRALGLLKDNLNTISKIPQYLQV
jgi:endogenous inhibitor of DNA gyrase (YacG/DUF329 family)